LNPAKEKHKCVNKVKTDTQSTTSKFMFLHKVFWTFIKEGNRRPRNEQKKSSKAQEVDSCAGWKRQGPQWPRPTMFFTYTYTCICTYLYLCEAEEQKKDRLTLLAWWWTVMDAGQICAPMASKHIWDTRIQKGWKKVVAPWTRGWIAPLNKSGLLLIVTNRDAQEEITNEQPKKIMLVNGN
jgi:hypothetical protein